LPLAGRGGLPVVRHVQGVGEDVEDQKIWVGEDDRGLELEVTAIVLADYLLVTHVMPTDLRKREKWPPKQK
jgi:hypothetical protein